MTIHHSHPFEVDEQDRNPLRRFRGRMTLPVSIWAAAAGGRRAGWTVASFLVADGDPGEVVGLVDEESALADLLAETTTVTVNLLGWSQRTLAGPVLVNTLGWIGARLKPDPEHAGWGLLLRGVVERVEIQANPADELLCYVRGRYRSVAL